MSKASDQQQACTKCGSAKTHVIGRSPAPPILYIRCSACGYTFVIAQPRRPA